MGNATSVTNTAIQDKMAGYSCYILLASREFGQISLLISYFEMRSSDFSIYLEVLFSIHLIVT